MKISYFIFVLYCSLVISCNSGNIDFPYEEMLTQELMPLQGITDPMRLEVKHPFLILQNSSKLNDSIYHIYDLNNYELKSVFGVRGEGPDEFVLPWLVQTKLSDFLIEDKHSFFRFSISKEGQPVLKYSIEPAYINSVNEAAFINDSLFVVDAQYTGPNLYLLSLQDELPKKSWKYRNPNMIDYYADPNMGNVYANKNRIVFCYGYKKQIDFMDTEFNLIKRVKFKYIDPAISTSPETQGDEKMSYVYSYLGKHYLYALFLGMTWNEYKAKAARETTLEVYDLNGNPIVRYHLDGRRPVYFVVDEETFTLYGTGENGDPEDNLLMYKLKGLS